MPISADKYLDQALKNQTGSDDIFEVKKLFSGLFKDRFAFDIEKPSQNPQFTDSLTQVSPGFGNSVNLIKEQIFSRTTAKYFDGISLSPRMMVHFLSFAVELQNKKNKLNYYDMLYTVLGQECELQKNIAKNNYKEDLKKYFKNR